MDDGSLAMAGLGLGFILIVLAVFVFLGIFPYWMICKKAGYSGAMSLLLLVPIANIIFLFYLALAEWPIQQRVRELEARMNPYGGGGYPLQQYPQQQYPQSPQYPPRP